jgi:hypothetical protein
VEGKSITSPVVTDFKKRSANGTFGSGAGLVLDPEIGILYPEGEVPHA